jgi:hypothetical protein
VGVPTNDWRSARARQVEDLSDILTFSGGARISLGSLFARASRAALGVLAAPHRALAVCSGQKSKFR